MIILTRTFSAVLDRIRRIIGTGAVSEVILNEMGKSAGKVAYEHLKATMGEAFIREQLSELINLYTTAGWGLATISELNFERKHAVVRFERNFECQPHKDAESKPYSHFVRGDLSGWFGEIFGSPVRCIETACIAKGDKFCEFSINVEQAV